MAELTQEMLKGVLLYDPETGIFTSKVRRGNQPAGSIAGCVNNSGYVKISVLGGQYLGHRLAWLYMKGWLPKQIDHVNCIRTDNRIKNLRPCSDALNHQNLRSSHADNSTGMLGVSLIKETGMFRARITIDGKCKQIGCFRTKEDAYAAYVQHKSEIHQFSTIQGDTP